MISQRSTQTTSSSLCVVSASQRQKQKLKNTTLSTRKPVGTRPRAETVSSLPARGSFYHNHSVLFNSTDSSALSLSPTAASLPPCTAPGSCFYTREAHSVESGNNLFYSKVKSCSLPTGSLDQITTGLVHDAPLKQSVPEKAIIGLYSITQHILTKHMWHIIQVPRGQQGEMDIAPGI